MVWGGSASNSVDELKVSIIWDGDEAKIRSGDPAGQDNRSSLIASTKGIGIWLWMKPLMLASKLLRVVASYEEYYSMKANQKERNTSLEHWEKIPCGINLPLGEIGTKTFFENLRRYKYEVDYPEILDFVNFKEWKGKDVLEVGCGLGSDSQTWCESGVNLTAIDFTAKAIEMTTERLNIVNQQATLKQANALDLPFKNCSFDLYYSWGVLMHTGDTQKALDEAYRVIRNGGEAIIMLYHKNSLLFRFYVQMLGRKFDDDAPITQFYTNNEMMVLCKKFKIIEMINYYFLRVNVSRAGKYIPQKLEKFLGRFWGSCTYLRLRKIDNQ